MRTTNDESAHRVTFIWNLPNVLTLLRIVLVPVFVVLLLQTTLTARLWALGVFVVASITDRYDGHLARKYDKVTNFGKIADPIADKVLIGSALLLLSYLGDIPWWVTIAILVRELGITVLRFIMVRRSVMAASSGGKLKAVLQIVGIGVLLVPWVRLLGEAGDWIDIVGQIIIYLALAVTVITGIDYVVKAVRISRATQR